MAEYIPSGKLVKDENLLQFAEGLKTAFYSKDEVDALVTAIPKFGHEVVGELPVEHISESTIYLVKSGADEDNLYTEYIYLNGSWEILGQQKVDLSNYATKTEVENVADDIPTNVSELTNDANYITAEANVASATKLETARRINGVDFNGTQDITVEDNTKLPLAGGNVTGPITSTSTISATQFTGDLEGTASKAESFANMKLLARSTVYAQGDVVYSAKLPSGCYLEATSVTGANTTAGEEPELSSVSAGSTVVDGEVTWTVRTIKQSKSTAADVAYSNEDYPTVAAALDQLLYVPVSVSSFTSTVTQAENGATVNDVTLKWSLKGKPTSVTLDSEPQSTELSGQKVLSELGLKTNKTWTLKAEDAKGTTDQKTVSLTFLNSIYYGKSTVTEDTSITSEMILGLDTSKLASNYKGTFTVNAGQGEYIYFAFPASFGNSPKFSVGGFEGGFNLVKTFDHTNASGAEVSYNVFRSTQPNLGNTSVVIA